MVDRGRLLFTDGTTATLSEDGWTSKDKGVERYLNAFYEIAWWMSGPSTPDYLGDLLRAASYDLSADIDEDNAPEQVEGRIY